MEGQDGFMALPRHAGRLTADIILNAPQGLNPCSEYELDLRSNKIGAIENLGATQNQFDAIDLSSNEIVKVAANGTGASRSTRGTDGIVVGFSRVYREAGEIGEVAGDHSKSACV